MNNQEFLLSVAQEIILPFINVLYQKLEEKYSKKEIIELIKKINLSEIVLLNFFEDADKNVVLRKLDDLNKIYELGIKEIDVMLILSYLYYLIVKFKQIHNMKTNNLYREVLDKVINNTLHKTYKKEFMKIEKNNLESMHYKDEEKISAKEFMEKEEFDEDIIIDIKDLLEDYEDMSYKYDVISPEFKEVVLEVLEKFVTLFMLSGEFKDLGKVIEMFFNELRKLDITSLDDNQKQFVKKFLDAFMMDIKKWYEEVIVNKSAKDIHYLDASLMSSVEQISYFIGGGVISSFKSIIKEDYGSL